MKKRLIAVILAITLLLAVIPMGTAVAAGADDVTITVLDENGNNITESGLSVKVTHVYGTYWTRNAEHDTETIHFGEDGSFSYSCSCGNPVNDSDLCDGYTYDDATKTITLDCIETTDEMITIIKIVKCDENSLHLDFDGEIRIFEK